MDDFLGQVVEAIKTTAEMGKQEKEEASKAEAWKLEAGRRCIAIANGET